MLEVITYNCQGLKNSLQDVSKLCQYYDFIFLQETWLFNFELHMLSSVTHILPSIHMEYFNKILGVYLNCIH